MAGDLITTDNVDVMMVTSTSDTVVPVADQAEALGVPCVSSDSPWQPFYFGRGGTPTKAFKWTYHAFWGIETNAGFQLDLWKKIKNNKVIGAMWPNDADGLALSNPKTGQPAAWTPAGYKIIDGGRYPDGSADFSTEISKFKAANAEIASGVMIPPDFVNYWKQVHQQGYKPIFCTMSKALLFPSELEAMGSIGYGLTAEVWWHPTFPYKSSLSRRDLPAVRRRLDRGHQEAVDAAPHALHRLRDRGRRPQAHDQSRLQRGDRRGGQSDQPRHARRSHQLHRRRRRPTPCPTSPPPRWPAASGSRVRRTPSTC